MEDTPTVLIADSSEDFRRELQNVLRYTCSIRTCSNGDRALKLIEELRPRVLVLDLMLPKLDGLSLLSLLSFSDCRPAILATTNLVSPYVLETADRMGVDYLLCKPCSLSAAAARVQELLDRHQTSQDLPSRVNALLLLLGLSMKLNGFKYLREAICRMIESPNQCLTKELYPRVARVFGCGAVHVERSIRGAIQDAWDKRDPNLWLLYFPMDGLGREIRPTNAAFIARLSDGLRNSLTLQHTVTTQLVPREEEKQAAEC